MDELSSDAANRYPYDATGDPTSEAFDYLSASEKDGQPHIPTFAQLMLERLRNIGLLHRRDTETPDNIRRVRFVGKQDLWLRFGTQRTPQGYKAVEVMDTPRSDKAILAAMIAWTSDPVDFEQLRPAIAYAYALSSHKELYESTMDYAIRYLQEGETSFEDFKLVVGVLNRFTRNQRLIRNLEFLLPLIEYYRPQIDDYSPEEQRDLLGQACEHVKDVVESLNRLQSFLEYGVPNKKLTPSIKQPHRDVEAAILSDVEDLNHRDIGTRMRLPLDPDELKRKGESQTVRKMIERGRAILQQAFAENGWPAHVESLKEEIRWWQSLSPEERDKEEDIERTALINDVSIEEARRMVDFRK